MILKCVILFCDIKMCDIDIKCDMILRVILKCVIYYVCILCDIKMCDILCDM